MIERLAQLISPDMRLEVTVLRLGEYYGACNVRPLADRFNIRRIYSAQQDGLQSTDFRPEYVPWGSDMTGRFDDIENVKIRGDGQIDMGGGRVVRLMKPPLRLLATNWLYDKATKTLLTSDHFNYVSQKGPDGPWVADSATPLPSEKHVRDFLVGTRYWWLPGARTRDMIEDMEKLFRDNDVERIGPGFGQILQGKDVVEKHVALLSKVLENFESEPATGVDAGYTRRSLKRAPMAGAAS